MEHHLLPRRPTKSTVLVPYVCDGPREDGSYTPYVEGSFFTYPTRVDKEWMLVSDDADSRTDVRLRQRLNFKSVGEQESFVQAWLFFGLLSAFLRSVYRAEDYIRVHEGETFVTTEKLVEKLYESWQKRSASATVEEKTTQIQNAGKCLQIVREVLGGCYESFDWRIYLSIASVAELFSRSITAAFEGAGITKEATLPPKFEARFPSPPVRDDMLAAGWCPSEVHSLSTRFWTKQTLIFLSRLEKGQHERDHSRCTEYTCQYYQINKEKYHTAHVQAGCACAPLRPDIDEICKIIYTPALPILKVNHISSKQPTVEVVSSADRPYVALSHVWADGLGNVDRNELPSCQITHIGRLIRDMQQKIASKALELASSHSETDQAESQPGSLLQEEDTIYLWVDTLCCPIFPEDAKLVAIKRMYETYSNAAQVLVLNGELRSINFEDVGNTEALLRVFNSGWIQRLWTLQEGVLPKSVWVQFADQSVDLDAVFFDLMRVHRTDLREMCIFQDIFTQYLGMRRLEHLMLGGDKTLNRVMSNLDNALGHRSVSFAADEALCLSNLLGLDPSTLDGVAADVEPRMVAVWKALAKRYSGLPQRLIMLSYPRLKTPGFRWAPRTLLRAGPGTHALSWADRTFGQVTDRGFEIRYPGIILKLDPIEGDLEMHKSNVHHDLTIPISFQCAGAPHIMFASDTMGFARGNWTDYPRHTELFGKNLGIIEVMSSHSEISDNANTWIAFLGEIVAEHEHGAFEFVTISPVFLQKSSAKFGEIFSAVHKVIARVNPARKATLRAAQEAAAHGQAQDNKPDPAGIEAPISKAADGEEKPVNVPLPVTRVNSGMLSHIDFPPIPSVIQTHTDDILAERPSLHEPLSLVYFTHDPVIVKKTLAWMVWVTMRYTATATPTAEDQVWCLT